MRDGRSAPSRWQSWQLAGWRSHRPRRWRAATLDDAQHLFYSALFQESAAAAKAIADAEPGNLAAWEVRTSALHFQLRRLFGEPKDRKAALARCAECQALLTTFLDDVNRGRAAARARIDKAPEDEEARLLPRQDWT